MEIILTIVSSFPLEHNSAAGMTCIYCPNCGAGMPVKEQEERYIILRLSCPACEKESKIILHD